MDKTKQKQIIKLISETLGVEENKVSLDSEFFSDLNTGRLELADLIIKLQKELNVEIEQERLKQIKTVEDLIKLIQEFSYEL